MVRLAELGLYAIIMVWGGDYRIIMVWCSCGYDAIVFWWLSRGYYYGTMLNGIIMGLYRCFSVCGHSMLTLW